MPLVLSKLRCGVIYTDAFSHFLHRLHVEQAPAHHGQILTLEYVRCASGPQKGRAWWNIHWVPESAAPPHWCFTLGQVRVHLPRSAQLGLKERCLDYEDGRVVVLPP